MLEDEKVPPCETFSMLMYFSSLVHCFLACIRVEAREEGDFFSSFLLVM